MATKPTPGSALLTVAATPAHLGLAVLGRGGFAAFCARPALVALAAALFAQRAAAPFSGGNLSPGEREDRGNRWALAAFGLPGLLSAFLPAYTDRIGFWSLDGGAARRLGVALFAVGGAPRIWPAFVLGRRFSGLVAIQPGHAPVTDGVYGTVRRPSYLGPLAILAGWALAFRSGVGPLLAVPAVPPLLARMRAEEALLRARFGGEHDAYQARAWRLLPGVY